MTRSAWRRPFRGGITRSTSSAKSSAPTRSFWCAAASASTAATSTASDRLGQRLAEPGRARLVHQQHQGQLALLGEGLDVGAAQPGRDVPVDGAEVVARLVGAHLGELHPLPAEDRAVLAGEQRADEPAGAELDALDLLQDFGG